MWLLAPVASISLTLISDIRLQGYKPPAESGRIRRAYSGSSRDGRCQVSPFQLEVGDANLSVRGLAGPARVVISHPEQIEPVVEEFFQVGSPDSAIALPLPQLDPGVEYTITATAICDANNPSRNPRAMLVYRIPDSVESWAGQRESSDPI